METSFETADFKTGSRALVSAYPSTHQSSRDTVPLVLCPNP
jgi:hypothetical protein